MGFKKVYKVLQEIFPQIDARTLRAVAIENSKDVDAAVETVLVEIIPFFTERSRSSSPVTRSSISVDISPKETVTNMQTLDDWSMKTTMLVQETESDIVNDGNHKPFHDATDENNEYFYDTNSVQHEGDGISEDNGVNNLRSEVSLDPQREGTIPTKNCQKRAILNATYEKSFFPVLGNLENVNACVNQVMELIKERENSGDLMETYFNVAASEESNLEKSFDVLPLQDLTLNSSEGSVQSVVLLPTMPNSILESSNENFPTGAAESMENAFDIVSMEDSTLNGSLFRSSQIDTMDVLDKYIADARNNKKTLSSAVESVISLMKEVELKEFAAELCKEEASKGDADVLDKMEELRLKLQEAKEHVGEVYGEKVILATELRELQSRVLILSDERDESLAGLDEMNQVLVMQLTAAENRIRSAEQEKLEKLMCADKALADQEMLMEKVLQEAYTLKQLAEENGKLREFLVDRSCVLDMLQGEIAVICQDVKQLKEKFDKRTPLSKSFSSSQTSCILTSSNSSLKSVILNEVDVPVEDNSTEIQQKRTHFPEEEFVRHDCALVEEGWEFL